MIKMLVIGGTSFIGSSMTKELIELGYYVDIVAKSQKEVFFEGYKNIIICDRSNEDNLKNAIIGTRYDYVIDIDNIMKQDVMNFLNASSRENIGKYILCSSKEVYSDFTEYLK